MYDFKKVSESQWLAVSGFLGAVALSAAQLAGLSVGDTAIVAAGTTAVSRMIISAFRGGYTFKEAWEVGWAGISAGSGLIAFIIANVNSSTDVTIGAVATAAAVLARPVLAAMLAALTKQQTHDLPLNP